MLFRSSSVMAARFSSADRSGMKFTRAVIPWGTVLEGITIMFLSSVRSLACWAAMMMFLLLGRMKILSAFTNIDGMEIEEGDIMAIGDHGMLAAGKSVDRVALDALKCMLDDDCELVTVYYGSDVGENAAKALVSQAEQMYPDKEIELQYGGQPIYYYMISAE